MEVFKTVLAGCGVLALLSAVGCVGIVGAGSYVVDQALEDQAATQYQSGSPPSRGGVSSANGSRFEEDPFANYENSAAGKEAGGWGDDGE